MCQAMDEEAACAAEAKNLEDDLLRQRAERPVQMPIIHTFEAFSAANASKKQRGKADKHQQRKPSSSEGRPHAGHNGSGPDKVRWLLMNVTVNWRKVSCLMQRCMYSLSM